MKSQISLKESEIYSHMIRLRGYFQIWLKIHLKHWYTTTRILIAFYKGGNGFKQSCPYDQFPPNMCISSPTICQAKRLNYMSAIKYIYLINYVGPIERRYWHSFILFEDWWPNAKKNKILIVHSSIFEENKTLLAEEIWFSCCTMNSYRITRKNLSGRVFLNKINFINIW